MKKNFRSVVFLVFFSLITAFNVHAESESKKYILDNGMTVVVTEVPSSSVVALQALVKTGSATEGKYLGGGISHFVEHMMFKGTEKRTVGEIAKEVKSLGGLINAHTSFDYTFYTIELPKENFANALDILSDMIMHSRFDPEQVEKERDVILGEIRMHRDDPDSRLSELVFANVYIRHPYRHPIIGYEPLLKSISRDQLFDYYQTTYVPNNIVVSVAGNIDSAEALTAVKKAFESFAPHFYPLRNLPVEPAQLGARYYEETYPSELTRLSMVYQGVSFADRDLFAMDVLAMILGQGGSSRLYQDVYQKQGLVKSISASNFTPMDAGVFEISLVLDEEKIEAALLAVKKNMEELKKKGVKVEELDKAKRQVLSHYLANHQASADIAGDAAINEGFIGDLNFSKKYVEAVRLLTADDIRRVANKYLAASALTTVILKPKAEKEIAPVAQKKNEPADITKVTLDNGLTILLRRDNTFPLLSIRVALLGGLRAETENTYGLANLMAGLWAKGTTSRSNEQISKEAEERGMSLGGFSGQNSFGVNVDCLAQDGDFAISLLDDILKNPTFPPTELLKTKEAVKAAISERDDDIFAVGVQALKRNLFGKHPYGHDALGTLESVETMSREDILSYYKKLFVPNNMVVSVFGDFNFEKMVTLLKSKFSKLPKSEFAIPSNEVIPLKEAHLENLTMDKTQALVMMGFVGAKLSDSDRYPLEVITSMLGSSLNSRLFTKIRDELGRAYTLGGRFTPGIDTGVVTFYVSTTAEHVERVSKILASELEDLAKNPVSDKELLDTQTYLKGTHQMSLETNASLASTATFDELYALGFDNYTKYQQNVDKVSKDDIMRVAKTYLDLTKAAIVIIRPKAADKN